MNLALKELGFSPDDRVVVVHADDIGMCRSTLPAIEELLAVGLVTSASVMVPSPCFADVVAWRQTHADADLGVHLTLTSEFSSYRWGPISTRSPGSGLVDEEGYLHRTAAAVQQRATRASVRAEIKAQFDLAQKSKLTPTHLDSHMYALMCDKFVEDYVQFGCDRAMPVFLTRAQGRLPGHDESQRRFALRWELSGMPVFDHVEVATQLLRVEDQKSLVQDAFERLPAGLSCVLIHPARDSSELHEITPDWDGRVADFEVFRDPALLDDVQNLGIQLISYQPLRDVLRSRLRRDGSV